MFLRLGSRFCFFNNFFLESLYIIKKSLTVSFFTVRDEYTFRGATLYSLCYFFATVLLLSHNLNPIRNLFDIFPL